jgi:RNA polymerase primary sigma factor
MDVVKDLIEKGKKRGILTYDEIINSLQGVDINADQIDDIYEML